MLSSQAEGPQTKLQGRDLGVLSGQAEGLQTRLQGRQGRLFFLRKGSGLAVPSNQVRQGFKERTFRGGEAK